MKSDLFQSCGYCWVFQICWHIECSTFTASSFRIWNSSTGILSSPLAFVHSDAFLGPLDFTFQDLALDLVYSKTGSKYFPHFCSEHNVALSYGDRAGESFTGDTRDGKVASSQKALAGIFNQSWQDLQTSGLAGSRHQQRDWKEKMSLCGFSTGETLLETLRNKRGVIKNTGRTVCSYISSLQLLATKFTVLTFLENWKCQLLGCVWVFLTP